MFQHVIHMNHVELTVAKSCDIQRSYPNFTSTDSTRSCRCGLIKFKTNALPAQPLETAQCSAIPTTNVQTSALIGSSSEGVYQTKTSSLSNGWEKCEQASHHVHRD